MNSSEEALMSRIFVIALFLTGCAGQYAPLPHAKDGGWTVTGRVVDSKSGRAIPGQSIDLIRVQRACAFCRPDSVRLMTLQADKIGSFKFSSEVPGIYELIAKSRSNKMCLTQVLLGELRSGEKSVEVVMKHEGCYFTL